MWMIRKRKRHQTEKAEQLSVEQIVPKTHIEPIILPELPSRQIREEDFVITMPSQKQTQKDAMEIDKLLKSI